MGKMKPGSNERVKTSLLSREHNFQRRKTNFKYFSIKQETFEEIWLYTQYKKYILENSNKQNEVKNI